MDNHVHATPMEHTPTGKPELVSVVCENLYISLDKSRCLDVHDTGASAPCNFLVLLPPPSTQHVGDPRVHKLTVLEISMTCVVNGVRHTSLCDALTRVIANVLPPFSFTVILYPNRVRVPSSPTRNSLTSPKHAMTVPS